MELASSNNATPLTQRHVAVPLALNGQNQHLTLDRVRPDQMQNGTLHTKFVFAGGFLVKTTGNRKHTHTFTELIEFGYSASFASFFTHLTLTNL